LIVEFAERIGRPPEQGFASARVPDGLDHTEWNRRGCHMSGVTKPGVKLDCHFQSGRSTLVVALPEGEHPQPKTRIRTLGWAERRLIDERMLRHLDAFAEKPGDPQNGHIATAIRATRPPSFTSSDQRSAARMLGRTARYSSITGRGSLRSIGSAAMMTPW